jgi:hypothetical protein
MMITNSAAALLALCSIAAAGCDGVGSRPQGENTSPVAGGEITLTGCVEMRGDAALLRATDTNSLAGREAVQLGNPDSSGGSLTHLQPAATAGMGSSTTANGAWMGSRTYVLAANSGASELGGKFVRVTGTVEAADAQPVGTDQMHAARGAIYPTLRASAVTPLDGSCAMARANTSDVDPPAAEHPSPADHPVR